MDWCQMNFALARDRPNCRLFTDSSNMIGFPSTLKSDAEQRLETGSGVSRGTLAFSKARFIGSSSYFPARHELTVTSAQAPDRNGKEIEGFSPGILRLRVSASSQKRRQRPSSRLKRVAATMK